MSLRDAASCPECGADLRGDPIADRPGEFYSLVVGLSDWDGVYAWLCPACGHTEVFDERRAERAKRDEILYGGAS